MNKDETTLFSKSEHKKTVIFILVCLLIAIWTNIYLGGPIHIAAALGNKAILQFLMRCGLNPADIGSLNRWTPLHAAAAYGNTETIIFLTNGIIDVSSQNSAESLSPIHYAAKHGQIDAIKTLVSKGADINQLSYDGDSLTTPLSIAIDYRQKEAAEYIRANGSDQSNMNMKNARKKEN